MPILDQDLKLLKSERLSDAADGGGRMTGLEVVDGQSNNLFPDVSDLSRVTGKTELRKVFPAALTDDTDTYMGANLIVLEPPDDPSVSVSLFAASSWADQRSAAADRLSSYLARGPRFAGYLYGNHIVGQRAVQLIQRIEEALPEVGQTLVLVQNEGLPNEYAQFIRLTDVGVQERTFTAEQGGEFRRAVVTGEISEALNQNFTGSEANYYDRAAPGAAALKTTVVADAAQYFGVAKFAAPGQLGDLTVQIASIFTQLVPSLTGETPLADLNAGGLGLALIKAGADYSYTTGVALNAGSSLYLGMPCYPGTLRITAGAATLVDNGGQLEVAGTAIGTVDAARGLVVLSPGAPSYGGGKTITFTPAGAPSKPRISAALPITLGTRGFVHSVTLLPVPQAGSLTVSYLAQGKWYELKEQGNGTLKGGQTAYGAGQLNLATGTLNLTLGALPDVGSSIILQWNTQGIFFDRSATAVAPFRVQLQAEHANLEPGSVTVTWAGGSLTDDGNGNLAGTGGSGTVNYATGEALVTPSLLPAAGTAFTLAYNHVAAETSVIEDVFANPAADGSGFFNLALSKTNIRPRSVDLTVTLRSSAHLEERHARTLQRRDNGSGGFPGLTGTLDYATGALSFKPEATIGLQVEHYEWFNVAFRFTGYDTLSVTGIFQPGSSVRVRYSVAGAASAHSVTRTVTALSVDLTPGSAETITANSARFKLGNRLYTDRNGLLITDIDPATGAATQAGTLDYGGGQASLSAWGAGEANTVTLYSLLTEYYAEPVFEVTFRTPGAPLRQQSLQILATLLDGTPINVTADANGDLNSARTRGHVTLETGIVHVDFGQMVSAAGHEGEWWYDPAQVVAGQIWQPEAVQADTLRYNGVIVTSLPLSANILGLDPVRLPIDGRVPIFKPGYVAVAHHTARQTEASPQLGVPISLGRSRIARVRVSDANGSVDPAKYSKDLNAGTLTFTSLVGVTAPVILEHTVEDMALVTDVEIGGRVTLSRPLSHAFPAGESYLSSALILGDQGGNLWARVTNLFDQQIWNGSWSDSPQGSASTAEYNATQFPLAVTNRGAIQERWAIKFTGIQDFEVYGESVGKIAIGNTTANCAPLNPATAVPYFTIPKEGWGGGWVAGNMLRFNTVGANAPVWIARTVLPSSPTTGQDSFRLQLRGNVDNP